MVCARTRTNGVGLCGVWMLEFLGERDLALQFFGTDLAFGLVVSVGLVVAADAAGLVGGTTLKLVFKVFRTKYGDFDEKELAGDRTSFGVVENCPDRDLMNRRSRRRIWVLDYSVQDRETEDTGPEMIWFRKWPYFAKQEGCRTSGFRTRHMKLENIKRKKRLAQRKSFMSGTTHKVLKLTPSLLNHTVLTAEHNAHSTKVTDLSAAYDE